MGAHVKRNFVVPSLPVGRVTAKLPWPNRPSGSGASKSNHGMDRQTVVPDFISNPFLPSKYGYQEVHAIYDEMRSFFAKRATSIHPSAKPESSYIDRSTIHSSTILGLHSIAR